jgi:hypothetical protein
MRSTNLTYNILLVFTVIFYGKEYNLWSSILRNFLQPPVTSSLRGPHIPLNTPLLASSLTVRDIDSYLYKTADKITQKTLDNPKDDVQVFDSTRLS